MRATLAYLVCIYGHKPFHFRHMWCKQVQVAANHGHQLCLLEMQWCTALHGRKAVSTFLRLAVWLAGNNHACQD